MDIEYCFFLHGEGPVSHWLDVSLTHLKQQHENVLRFFENLNCDSAAQFDFVSPSGRTSHLELNIILLLKVTV